MLLLFVDMILKSLLLGLWTDLLWGWRHWFPWRTGIQHQPKDLPTVVASGCSLIPLFWCCSCFSSACDGLPFLTWLCVYLLWLFLACSSLAGEKLLLIWSLQEQSNVVFALSSELIHCSFLSPAFRSASCRNSGMWWILPSPLPEGGRGCRAGEKCVSLVTHAAFC